MDFVHQLVMEQNFRSLKALQMQIMTFLFTSFRSWREGAKRVRNLVCGIQEDFIAILWMLSFDSVCHHFPIALSASYPRKLALPCSVTSRKYETLEKHVGRYSTSSTATRNKEGLVGRSKRRALMYATVHRLLPCRELHSLSQTVQHVATHPVARRVTETCDHCCTEKSKNKNHAQSRT
jgi:hypothetical protein